MMVAIFQFKINFGDCHARVFVRTLKLDQLHFGQRMSRYTCNHCLHRIHYQHA